ncbi:MAG: sodium:solute symporter, partial [Candidatus Omnitrophica bacterium]|nr:sodium:solute symporter [Candidatus Omnitrophota bacterium]
MEDGTQLRTGDLLAIAAYFGLTMAIGFWCMRKNKTTEDFFMGGRSVPGWAIGISLLGAAISSITFLAYPGNGYAKDWSYLVPGLMLPVAAVLGAYVFSPFYRRSGYTSAYEYLEGRFGPGARLYGSALFTIQTAWRLGSVLYLLCIPIQRLTGWDSMTVIWLVGITTTIYCVVGGLEAVIWTDVMQTFVFLIGGLACVGTVFLWPGVGPSHVFETAFADNKFNVAADTTWTLNKETLWVLILWGLVSNIQEHVSDQGKIQRYCAAGSDGQARRAVMFNGISCIPTWCLFMFIGTCLYAFYKVVPDPVVSTLKADEIFPHFILTKMPVGLSGLVIAAIMAAAMSTLSSAINAGATVLTVDIYKRRFKKDGDDKHYLNVGKIFTLMGGIFMIATAIWIQKAAQDSFLPMSFFITSIVVGGLGGVFCLGFFSTRANNQGVIVGICGAILVIVYLTLSAFDADPSYGVNVLPDSLRSPTHKFMIGVFGNIGAFVLGYFASFLFPPPSEEQIKHATLWT